MSNSFSIFILTRNCISIMCEKKRFVFNGGYVFLQESNAMTERFFEVCDITTTNPGLVSNDDFLKRMMANAEVDSD